MPAPDKPTKLADDLWLAAHDTLKGKSRLADRPLDIGLGAAILGELLFIGNIAVESGAIFVRAVQGPGDPSLAPIVRQLAYEELSRRRRNPAGQQSGLGLRDWIRYLATGSRAQELVTARLMLMGAVRHQQSRSLFGSINRRFVPVDSIISGVPVSRITLELKQRVALDQVHLTLAGLFLATGLYPQVFAAQPPDIRHELGRQLRLLHPMLRELLRATEQVIGEAAMLR